MTTGAEQPRSLAWLLGRMTGLGITSTETEEAIGMEQRRVSKVTLALLLRMHLQEGERLARTYAFQALQRAIDGLSTSARGYAQAELTCAALATAIATCEMSLTQCATVEGFLLGSGALLPALRSYRIQRVEILSTSGLLDLCDAEEFTIKQQRARRLTRWALGDGKFNAGMDLRKMWDLLSYEESDMLNGWQYT